MSIKCDDRGTVYADGIKMFNCENSFNYNIIPRATRVVSIVGYNDGGHGDVAAAFSNGFTTFGGSDKWKCTDQEYPGWREVNFDDSGWSQAWDHGPENSRIGPARNIWTRDITELAYVYCRGHISECFKKFAPH